MADSVLPTYAPVARMQDKAAQIRAQLAELEEASKGGPPAGSIAARPSTAMAKGLSMKPRLSVVISESGSGPERKEKQPPTPANPRFKPNRQFVTTPEASPGDMVPPTPSWMGQGTTEHPPPHQQRSLDWQQSMGTSSSKGGGTAGGTVSISDPQKPGFPCSSFASHRGLTSPSRSRSGSPLKVSLALQEANNQLGHRIHNLEEEVARWKGMYDDVQADLESRQDSYMRREELLQLEISQLQAKLARAQGERPADDEMFGKATGTIKQLHTQVVSEIEALLDKQATHLKHEEQSTLRRFKNKLATVEAELLAERGANGATNSEWLERTRALRAELETVQEIATKLDKMYRLSEEECQRLRAQFKCQEDDREYLIRQIVHLKKEKQRLTVELAAMAAEANAAVQERNDLLAMHQGLGDPHQPMMPAQMAATMSLAGIDKDAVQVKVQRYEDVIESLKRLLEAERRRTKQARAAHTAELASRTELQVILRQCVDDIRARRQAVEAGADISSQGTSRYGPADGEAAGPGPGSMGLAGASASGGRVPRAASAFSTVGRAPGSRPLSAMPHSSASFNGRSINGLGAGANHSLGWSPGASSQGGARPTSAVRVGASNFGPSVTRGRPFSAVARMQARPLSAVPGRALGLSGPLDTPDPGNRAGYGESDQPMVLSERETLVGELLQKEEVLKQVFEAAFPAVAPPSLPGDTVRLDKMVAQRETRDATVVANARALAAMRAAQPAGGGGGGAAAGAGGAAAGGGQQGGGGLAARMVPASVAKDATPGSELQKDAAGKPWVFNVDRLLQDFLQGNAS